MKRTTIKQNTITSENESTDTWIALFVDGPAGGKFVRGTKPKSKRQWVWIDKTSKSVRIDEPLWKKDEYATRVYEAITIDEKRKLTIWQLVPLDSDEPLILTTTLYACKFR